MILILTLQKILLAPSTLEYITCSPDELTKILIPDSPDDLKRLVSYASMLQIPVTPSSHAMCFRGGVMHFFSSDSPSIKQFINLITILLFFNLCSPCANLQDYSDFATLYCFFDFNFVYFL